MTPPPTPGSGLVPPTQLSGHGAPASAPMLIAPLKIDALVLGAPACVDGPDLDFTGLPWSDGRHDHNMNTPNHAAAVTSQPGFGGALRLDAGVHLHWALPDGLTRGGTDLKERPWLTRPRPGDRAGPYFPPIPNRWLVRRVSGKATTGLWIVESDHVSKADPALLAERGPSGLPVGYPRRRRTGDVSAPFVHMGRSLEVAGAYTPAPEQNYAVTRPEDFGTLTCVGYGNPDFAALYGNCRSVLGFHDATLPEAKVLYEVAGWYAVPGGDSDGHDPLAVFRRWCDARSDAQLRARINRERAARMRPDADLLREDTPIDAALRREAEALLLADSFGWHLDADQPGVDGIDGAPAASAPPLPLRLICFGRTQIDPSTPGAAPVERLSETETIGVGHSGVEAANALIAWGLRDTPGERALLERKLDALRLGARLRDHGLDLGFRFEEVRHDARFETARRQQLWRVRAGQADTARDGPDSERVDLRLPDPLAHALHDLNAAQALRDEAAEELDDLRLRLHCNWQLWMTLRYVRNDARDGFALDIDALTAVLSEDLAEVESRIEALKKLGGLDPNLPQGDLARAYGEAKALLETAVLADPALAGLSIVPAPGPRFAVAKDLQIALAHDWLGSAPRRFGQDGRDGEAASARCLRIDGWSYPDGLSDAAEMTAFMDAIAGLHPEPRLGHGTCNCQGRSTWEPFRLEWEVEYRALEAAHADTTLRLPEDFIARNFQLAETGHELRAAPSALHATKTSVLTGRSHLSPHAPDLLRGAVAEFAASGVSPSDAMIEELQQAAEFAELAQPRTASLSGLNAALVGLSDDLRLPVSDPLGFPEEQELTRRIAEALGDAHMPSPRIDAEFLPLRSGSVSVRRLRLVDGFGQAAVLAPRTAALSEAVADGAVGTQDVTPWIPLPPRFAKPARLAVEWLSTLDGAPEMNDAPVTTPVFGWVSISHLDRGDIALHDAEGVTLGSIDLRGKWQVAPGDSGTLPMSSSDIPDETLARVAGWLSSRTPRQTQPGEPASGPPETPFTEAFSAAVEKALAQVNPRDVDDASTRALLTARPLALARCRIRLDLAGLPSEGRTILDASNRVQGAEASTRGIEAVRFPLQVGAHGRATDGIVGFWIDVDQGPLAGPRFANDRFYSVLDPDELEAAAVPPDRAANRFIASGCGVLEVAPGSPPVTLTILFDPRAAVHLTCPATPTRTLRLPPSHFRPQMGRIGFVHLAAPLLMAEGSVSAFVPEAPGADWTWLSRDGETWREVPQHPSLTRDRVLETFPDGGDRLWEELLERGWLDPDALRDAPRFRPPESPDCDPLPPPFENTAAVLSTLHRLAESIERPLIEPHLERVAELREGWLRLDTRPEAASTRTETSEDMSIDD